MKNKKVDFLLRSAYLIINKWKNAANDCFDNFFQNVNHKGFIIIVIIN